MPLGRPAVNGRRRGHSHRQGHSHHGESRESRGGEESSVCGTLLKSLPWRSRGGLLALVLAGRLSPVGEVVLPPWRCRVARLPPPTPCASSVRTRWRTPVPPSNSIPRAGLSPHLLLTWEDCSLLVAGAAGACIFISAACIHSPALLAQAPRPGKASSNINDSVVREQLDLLTLSELSGG